MPYPSDNLFPYGPGDYIIFQDTNTVTSASSISASQQSAVVDAGIMASSLSVFEAPYVSWGGTNQITTEAQLSAYETLVGRSFVGNRINQSVTVANIKSSQSSFTNHARLYQYRMANAEISGTHPSVGLGWAAVAAGTHDSAYIDPLLSTIAADTNRFTATNPFVFAFHHEQTVDTANQVGYPTNGTQQEYINAFRHVRDRADALGVTVKKKDGTANGGNCVFAYVAFIRMWMSPVTGQSLDDFDPNQGSSPAPGGTSYYELMGGDLYNQIDPLTGVLKYGTDAAPLLDPLHTFALARNMRFILPECGVSDGPTTQNHQDKAAFLASMQSTLKSYGSRRAGTCEAILWTCKVSSENFTWNSSTESSNAFIAMAGDLFFSQGLPVTPPPPPPPPPTDSITTTFSYLSASGWATAEDGHTWAHKQGSGVTESVDGDNALMVFGTTSLEIEAVTVGELNWSGSDTRMSFSFDARPSGTANHTIGMLQHYVDNSNYYEFRCVVSVSGQDQVSILRRATGTTTNLTGGVNIGIGFFAAATTYFLRVQTDNSGGALRLRVWDSSTTEPGSWTTTFTDNPNNPLTGTAAIRVQQSTGDTPLTTFRFGEFIGTGTPN